MINIGMTSNQIDMSDRLLAVGELEKNAVVLAGAGTGKTTLLVDRLALLIVGKGIAVEKIVALTFTKKAAEEMRVRLERILRDVIVSVDSGESQLPSGSLLLTLLSERYHTIRSLWKSRAEKALEDIPKAQLGTIHGFASYLLRLYPLQGKVDPAFREDEGERFDALFDESWRLWLADELNESAPREKWWGEILKSVDLVDLRDVATELVSPRVEWDKLKKKEDLQKLAIQWKIRLQSLLISNPPSVRAVAQKALLRAMGDVFETLAAGHALTPELADQITKDAELDDVFDDLRSLAKAAGQVDEKSIALTLEILGPFVEKFRKDLSQRGIVSFDGLLVFARNLVRDHLEVRKALKRQFETFLIDEFQDTDPLQGEILFCLAEDPVGCAQKWQDVKLSPGRLFVVGDPKQSIYRFRGADIAAFEAFEKAILSDSMNSFKATLTQNFRSGPGLIGFINQTLPSFMKEEPGLQPAYIPLVSGREDEAAPPVSFVDMEIEKGDAAINADEARRLEGRVIAEWIKSYKGPYSDVALLFRSTSAFVPYLNAFREAGIPYLAEGEKFFYRTPEVMEFLNVLGVVHRPEDTLALVGVLRSPLGGLTDQEIWDLKKANGLDIRQAPPVFADKVGTLYKLLKRLHERSAHQTVAEVVEGIFRETLILPLASQAIQGEQALANLQKIRLLADKWSSEGSLTVGSFLKRFIDYRRDEKEEGENPLADVKYEAVKVMTIHKAKGLEFSSVILPDLHRLAAKSTLNPPLVEIDWRTGRVGLRLKKSKIINTAMLLVEEEIKLRDKAENARVFYVALTRAKQNLRLHVRSGEPRGLFTSYLKSAGAFPGEAESLALGKLSIPIDRVTAKSGSRSLPPPKSFEKNGQSPALSDLVHLFQKREAEFNQSKNRRSILSPSIKMNEPEKIIVTDEEEGGRSSPHAISLGLLCHKVLEDWDFTKQSPLKSLSDFIQKAGRPFELFPEDPLSLIIFKEAEEILTTFLQSDSYKTLAGATILGREIPFLYSLDPTQNDGATVMRGVIDVLYELNGKLVVGDYKTTKIRDNDPEKTAASYEIQSEIYREVIKRSFNKSAEFEVIFLRIGKSIFLSQE